MKKTLLVSELDNIAVLMENDRAVEFFVNRGELLLGDIYTATVENILPGIDAAFVNLGKDKMGFLHANDVPGTGFLKERLVPKQKLLVQITKEPTGHKGPRVSTAISLPGRFLVLVPEERGISISRRISEAKERARLKSVVNLMKPPGVGLIIRTEAKGQGEDSLFEDFETLWDRWQTIVSDGEASIGPTLIYRDQDLLYRVIRDAYSTDISEIIVDSADGQKRAQDYMAGWAGRTTKILQHMGEDALLLSREIDKEIEAALSDRVELPSGGHLNIQPTEALTVIDVNSGRFTSSRTQAETVRRTNLEAAHEIPRQLRLRNIGGMVIVDFIDMDSRRDQQQVLEVFQRALEDDRAKPQIGQLSDLGLVELTRRRQGQSLRELFTHACAHCAGLGAIPTLELGTGENKRVLTVKPKEEDLVARARAQARRGGGGRQQGAALRAVSAGSGRVKPMLVEPEEESDVPDDILDQVPDDLLEPSEGKSRHARANFTAGRLNLEDDLDIEEEIDELPIAEPAALDDDEEITRRFGVQDRFQPDDTLERQAQRQPEEPPAEPAMSAVAGFEEALEEAANGRRSEPVGYAVVEDETAGEEVTDVMPLPESPFETEIDPVTGVYRLKAKSTQQPAPAPGSELSGEMVEAEESGVLSPESPPVGVPGYDVPEPPSPPSDQPAAWQQQDEFAQAHETIPLQWEQVLPQEADEVPSWTQAGETAGDESAEAPLGNESAPWAQPEPEGARKLDLGFVQSGATPYQQTGVDTNAQPAPDRQSSLAAGSSEDESGTGRDASFQYTPSDHSRDQDT